MQKKYKNAAEKQAAYLQRKKEKEGNAVEERAIRDHLWFFGEVIPRIDARTHAEELAIHREFLRALGEQDVQPGETLRDVARRTWVAWTKGSIYDEPDKVHCPGFNRQSQQWNPVGEGFVVNRKSFDEMWVPPADCANGEADQPINLNDLPKLPKLKSEPKPIYGTGSSIRERRDVEMYDL